MATSFQNSASHPNSGTNDHLATPASAWKQAPAVEPTKPSTGSRNTCLSLGMVAAACALLTFVAGWLEAGRYHLLYDLGWLPMLFFPAVIFGALAFLGALASGVAELILAVGPAKYRIKPWRTLAGLGLASLVPLSLLPSASCSTDSRLRCHDMNSLRQLGLANLNYESAHSYFPPMYGKSERSDAPGKGLSWRVHILPFLEEADLYSQFHLDEPWDSPHNLKLLPKMPSVYESRWPLDTGPAGHTLFQRLMGYGAFDPGDGKGIRFKEISDGSHDTVMLVQVNSDHAVPWTKPRDYVFDPKGPLRGLRDVDHRNNCWIGVTCSGSTFADNFKDVPTEKIRAMFTRDAGDVSPDNWP